MQTHNLKQGENDWHEFRAKHFGASEAAAMLGISPYLTRNDPNYKQFSKWFKTEGCLTESQANVIVNDIMFQMDFAVAGSSIS